jgi:hypothetical protein
LTELTEFLDGINQIEEGEFWMGLIRLRGLGRQIFYRRAE